MKLEEAAMKSVCQFGVPDISGGYVIEDDLVYFKNKNGHTSLVITLEDFEKLNKEV